MSDKPTAQNASKNATISNVKSLIKSSAKPNATLVVKKVAQFASHTTKLPDESSPFVENAPSAISEPASAIVESLVQKNTNSTKKDDELKVEKKVNVKEQHKDDIKEAFTGHIRKNIDTPAGQKKE